MTPELEVKNLHVNVDGKPILKGLNLTVNRGEVHAIMGPNGSGKSTLSYTIMGHPKYEVTQGEILLRGQNVLEMEVDKRAKEGLFLGFQYPMSVPGVTMQSFLHSAYNAVKGKDLTSMEFNLRLLDVMKKYDVQPQFAKRHVNEGFSGGEKKRAEILQMAILEPSMCILDEPDSGLDVDALKVVADGIQKLRGKDRGILIITHYQRILNHAPADRISIVMDGRVVANGGPELALRVEREGYDWLKAKA
ncbi:MAG TPA: Fe-S cluster assembly ATPase SufC [Candidatus Thermoplasmatota archaeon]|nr:Fe-S cluster assembly ATPase SufC [Candidatus Thermoplasmatota archaeon]